MKGVPSCEWPLGVVAPTHSDVLDEVFWWAAVELGGRVMRGTADHDPVGADGLHPDLLWPEGERPRAEPVE